MALIDCPDCGKMVSTNAVACPACGAPITSATLSPAKGERVPYTDQEIAVLLSQKWKTNHLLHLVLSLLTAGLWVLVWILVALDNSYKNGKIDRMIAQGKRPRERAIAFQGGEDGQRGLDWKALLIALAIVFVIYAVISNTP